MNGDLAAFVEDLAVDTKAFVTETVSKATGRVWNRVTELEQRIAQTKDGAPGRDGKDADPLQIKAMVDEAMGAAVIQLGALIRDEIGKALAAIPPAKDGASGRDGKDADLVTVKAFVEAAVVTAAATIPDRVKAEVATALAAIPVPKDGRDGSSVTAADVAPLVTREVATAVAALPRPKDGAPGKSVDPEDVSRMVTGAVAALPVPKDGKDADPLQVKALVESEVLAAVAKWPVPKDGVNGKDVDPAVVEAMVEAQVKRWPIPKDGTNGKDVDPLAVKAMVVAEVAAAVETMRPEDPRPLIKAEVASAVAAIPTPKDGVGVVDALINRDHHLIVTLSNGGTKDVGLVVGQDVDMSAVQARIDAYCKALPPPEPGKDGVDGKDGLGIEETDLAFDEERGWMLRLSGEGREKTLRVPIPWDAGPYRAGRRYPKGAMVVRRSSQWIAQADTFDEPGDGKTAWRLNIKRPELKP